jgi:hypothetical protein
MTIANYNRTLVARLVRKMKATKPNTWAKRAGAVSSRRKRYRTVRYGQGLRAQQALQGWRKTKYRPMPRFSVRVRDLLALELAQRRADAWKAERKAAEAREQAGDSLFDECMSGRNTMPPAMAWPERYEETLIDWDAFDAQWTYDRSIKAYVKNDASLYTHWAT